MNFANVNDRWKFSIWDENIIKEYVFVVDRSGLASQKDDRGGVNGRVNEGPVSMVERSATNGHSVGKSRQKNPNY